MPGTPIGQVTWASRQTATAWTTAGGDFSAAVAASTATGTTDNVTLSWTVTTEVDAFVNGGATSGPSRAR